MGVHNTSLLYLQEMMGAEMNSKFEILKINNSCQLFKNSDIEGQESL